MPDQFGGHYQARGEPGDAAVEQTARKEKKEDNHHEEEDLVDKADEKIRLVPVKGAPAGPEGPGLGRQLEFEGQHFHRACQQERIDRRIRQVRMHGFEPGGVGDRARRRRLRVDLLDQGDAQRPDEERGVTFALSDIAGQLRRVHGLLAGHIAKRAPVVADHGRDQNQKAQTDAEVANAAAGDQPMYEVLRQRHFTSPRDGKDGACGASCAGSSRLSSRPGCGFRWFLSAPG